MKKLLLLLLLTVSPVMASKNGKIRDLANQVNGHSADAQRKAQEIVVLQGTIANLNTKIGELHDKYQEYKSEVVRYQNRAQAERQDYETKKELLIQDYTTATKTLVDGQAAELAAIKKEHAAEVFALNAQIALLKTMEMQITKQLEEALSKLVTLGTNGKEVMDRLAKFEANLDNMLAGEAPAVSIPNVIAPAAITPVVHTSPFKPLPRVETPRVEVTEPVVIAPVIETIKLPDPVVKPIRNAHLQRIIDSTRE